MTDKQIGQYAVADDSAADSSKAKIHFKHTICPHDAIILGAIGSSVKQIGQLPLQ